MKQILFSLLVVTVLAACKSDHDHSGHNHDHSAVNETAFDFSQGYYRKGYAIEEERYTLVPTEKSVKIKGAELIDFTYENGVFKVDYKGFDLGAETSDAAKRAINQHPEGQYIVLLVGKNKRIILDQAETELDLPNGQHNILVGLTTSYHEILKDPKAVQTALINVKDGSIVNRWDIPGSAIFLNMPLPNYTGADAKRVLIDYYPVNCKIGQNAYIELYVNGEYKYLRNWDPLYVETLPFGQNTVAVKLVDALGDQLMQEQSAIRRPMVLERGGDL